MNANVHTDEGDKADAKMASSLRRRHKIAEELQVVHQYDACDFIKDLYQVLVPALQWHIVNQVNDHYHRDRILDLKLKPERMTHCNYGEEESRSPGQEKHRAQDWQPSVITLCILCALEN